MRDAVRLIVIGVGTNDPRTGEMSIKRFIPLVSKYLNYPFLPSTGILTAL